MESVEILAQAYSQAPWRKQLQMIVGFLMVLVVMAIVAGIYLSVSARTVALGHEIMDFQSTIEETERKISDLETQLAYITSSSVMVARALEMGMERVEPEQIFYIVVPGYVDRPEAVLAPPPQAVFIQAPLLEPAYSESLIDWLKENVLNPGGLISEVKP